jgi:hypothetical protein
MTVYTLQAPMPAIALFPGMQVKLEAIEPSTGAAITGVTCSAWSIYGEDLTPESEQGDAATPGPFMLVPGPAGEVE